MELDFSDLLSTLPEVQVLEDANYETTNCLYRIDYDGISQHVHVFTLPVLSKTKTGYWIQHPYKYKKKRFVRAGSLFAAPSIAEAMEKFKERCMRRHAHIKNALDHVNTIMECFDKVVIQNAQHNN